MKYLHAHKTMHRDLKSQNVLVFADGKAKVADFGRSKNDDVSATATADGFVGSYTHAAPETIADAQYSEYSDVYSFGVIVWECLTGGKPWHGQNVGQIILKVAGGERPAPAPDAAACDDVDAELAKLMRECWAQEAMDRPLFGDVVRRLEALQGKGAGETRAPARHKPN